MTSDAPVYVAAHIHEALAEDPRVAEPGIEVTVAGDRVFLTGTVMTATQREAAGELTRSLVDGLEICNDLEVLDGDPQHGEPERLA
jgi:osmotically-inducible protein OsmY